MHTQNARNPSKKNIKRKPTAPQGQGPARPVPGSHAQTGGCCRLAFYLFFAYWVTSWSGIIIHTFEIKSSLILISNPIRAHAYTKCKKPIEKTIKRKPTAPQGRGPGRPGPGSQAQTGGAVGLRFIVFSIGFLHFGYAYALIGLEINIRLDLISNVCIIIRACWGFH